MSLKIGIHDHMFFSLQRRFALEGAEQFIYAGPNIFDPETFNITGVENSKITQVQDLLDVDADFYLSCTLDTGFIDYESLKCLNKPVIGYSAKTQNLEMKRSFAFKLLNSLDTKLHVPKQIEFLKPEDVIDFLTDNPDSWVIKQNLVASLVCSDEMRTVITHPDHTDKFDLICENPAWFNKNTGEGGVILEEYFGGYEVCFAAWFDGDKFISPFYACEEHKDAQNGSRSCLMTGEVGTWLTWYHEPKGDVIDVFRKLEPVFKDKFQGMFDINTKFDPKTGKLHFIEFTPRFGRPTLELMLGSSHLSNNWSEAFYAMSTKSKNYEQKWSDLFGIKHAICIGVYSYGIPIINHDSPPGVGLSPIKFKIPNKDLNTKDKIISFQPFAAAYRGDTWMTQRNERQFFMIGASNNMDEARDLAYSSLEGYSLLGCTWRDDIGLKQKEITEFLASTKNIY